MNLYNEIDPFASAWLRELATRGHIADGLVESRSIADLKAEDVYAAAQAHFFAGIGGWSRALRLAAWPDDVPVWTGSCPCQPFSTAGRKRGTADERHLWPVWSALIQQCRPAVVFGEQVASPDGLKWLDAVRADLEGAGYAFGASDLCAAGVGAPHIRQRLYFVAVTDRQRLEGLGVRLRERGSLAPVPEARWRSSARGLADDGSARREGQVGPWPALGSNAHGGTVLVAGRGSAGLEGHAGDGGGRGGWSGPSGSVASGGAPSLMGDASSARAGRDAGAVPREEREGARERQLVGRVLDGFVAAGATRGAWTDAEWILCRDGKARPVEPGAFPLAHGVPARMGRLRGYGNAIVPQVAATFIRAVMEALWL